MVPRAGIDTTVMSQDFQADMSQSSKGLRKI